MRIRLAPAEHGCRGTLQVPADKSISHRSLIFGALADGTTRVTNFLRSRDCRSTLKCLQLLGVKIEESGDVVVVQSGGPPSFHEPEDVLDAGNSGTTMRLLSGLVAGLPLFCCFTGDGSLKKRPMGRVIEPLRQMGAQIWGGDNGKYAPFALRGGSLRGIRYDMPVASAQVKSALLLAGLSAEGVTEVREPVPSRDHTEKMLEHRGVQVERSPGGWVSIRGGQRLKPRDVVVPGDPSSAAFLGSVALLVRDSEVELPSILINPTRIGFLEMARRMGADIELNNVREVDGEQLADLRFKTSLLRGIEVGADEVPAAIDELPMLAVLASQAEGQTVLRGAEELRVKESDRIAGICGQLRLMGADIEECPDGFVVNGPTTLRGTFVETFDDHRLAMALGVAAQVAEGTTTIDGAECVDVSFPGFWQLLQRSVESPVV